VHQTSVAMNWARMCVLFIFLDSWLFLFISGVLIFGIGLEFNAGICSAAIYLCIACYGTSKLFIYCFLIERVHVVWQPTSGARRFKSPVYIICAITVALYGVIAALLVFGRIHYFRDDGSCVVGVKKISSISLLSYDLFVNVFLTTLFLYPLLNAQFLSARIKRVATRTLIAAGVALTTSTINVVVLTVLKGQELGWICLGSCGSDVLFNALAIYWVTGNSGIAAKPSTVASALKDTPVNSPDVKGRAVAFASPASPSNSKTSQWAEVVQSDRPKRASAGGGVIFAPQMPNTDAEDLTHKKGFRLPSFFRSFTQKRRPASGINDIQITVTTEYEMDGVPVDRIPV